MAQSPWQGLTEMASLGRSQLREPSEGDLGLAKTIISERYQSLVTSIAKSNSNAIGWQRFLASAKIAPAYSNDEEIDRVIQLLQKDTSGMEWQPLLHYRGSLEEYLARKSDLEASGFSEEFHRRVEKIHQSLVNFETNQSALICSNIAKETEWLLDHQQLPLLANQIRERSLHDNVRIDVSKRLIAAYVQDHFQKLKPVSDCILGTAIVGQATVAGSSDVTLVSDPTRLHLNIVVSATANSDTIGYNGPVKIYSAGVTRILTKKPIYFDGRTIFSTPAVSEANTQSHLKGIESKFSGVLDRIVKKVATNQTNKKKGEGNAIASRHTERDTNKETDSEVEKLVQDGNRLFYEEVRRPWLIRGIYPKRFDLSSEPEKIRIRTTIADNHQLGAPAIYPVQSTSSDVSAVIHQSCVNNLLASYFAGKSYTVKDLEGLILGSQKQNELPEKKSTSESAPSKLDKSSNATKGQSSRNLSLTLDQEAPLRVLFDQGSLVLTIGARNIEVDGRSYAAMNITLRFKMTAKGENWIVEFDGAPVIAPQRLDYDATSKLSGSEIAIRRILTNYIVRDFPKSTEVKPYTLDRNGKKIGLLKLSSFDARNGWIAVNANFLPSAIVR